MPNSQKLENKYEKSQEKSSSKKMDLATTQPKNKVLTNLKDQIFKKRISRKLKIQASIFGLLALALVLYLVWDFSFAGPLASALSNKEKIISAVQSSGIFAPMIYILVQIIQTVVAPIPGQIASGVGGFLFGWWGVLWTIIGSGIGFWIVFSISRRFGRPFVEKVVKKELLDKFDFVSGRHASTILFLIFLIPGLPDDAVCYIAGLTDVSIKKLMFLIIVGHFPSIVVTNYIGSGLGEKDLTPVIIISLFIVLLLIFAFLQKDKIMKFLKKDDSKNQS